MDTKRIVDVQIEGFDAADYPDFRDAYISSASVKEGEKVRPLNENELEKLNEDDGFVKGQVQGVAYYLRHDARDAKLREFWVGTLEFNYIFLNHNQYFRIFG
jgi:hypothetical protein